MPYSGPGDDSLPQNVKDMNEGDRKQWIAIFNKTMADCRSDDPKVCEANAFRLANGVMKKMMAHIQANASGPARRVTHGGRQYLVAPFTGIVQNVLNGELVPLEELAKFPESWNGRPVVLGHPQKDGEYISANSPDLLAQAMGQIHNARLDGDRLRWENWLDIERCQALGGDYLRAMQQIEAGQPTEGSTAYWRDIEAVSGTWQGKDYNGIARNLRPDHYAILLNEPGACSWSDGCGGPRVNQKENDMLSTNGKRKFGNLMTRALETWITQENTRQKVIASLAKKAEMDPADFERALGGQLDLDEETARRVGGALGIPEDEISKAMATEPVPATEPAANAETPTEQTVLTFLTNLAKKALRKDTEESAMTQKCELIDRLVANGCKVKREALEAMEEQTLQALTESFPAATPNAGGTQAQPDPAPPPAAAPAPAPAPATAPAIPEEIQALAQLVKELGGVEGVKATLSTIQANTQNERDSLIQEIVAGSQMTAEELSGLQVNALKKLAQTFRPATYFRAMPSAGADSDWEEYKAPAAQNGK